MGATPLYEGIISRVTPRLDASNERSLVERLAPFLVVVITATVAVLAVGPWPVGVFQDDGIYAVLGKSLATGQGYRYLHLPGAPNATHYPPLYPALLAVLWRLWPDFPRNVILFKFANVALTALASYFAFIFARDRLRLRTAVAAVSSIAFGACAPVVLLTVMLLSEPFFLMTLFPVLFIAERAVDSGDDRDAAAAGIAGALLALIRTLGIVVVPATALALMARRRWRAAWFVCAAGMLASLPWQLWVTAHASEVPAVFLGKYGSYTGWLTGAVRAEGPLWLVKLVWFNLAQIVAQGWATVAVDTLAPWIRWSATAALTALFALGWWRLRERAPVAAWTTAFYLALVVAWPFMPARFTWGIWPLIGFAFVLGIDAVARWRPPNVSFRVARWAAVAVLALLVVGYGRYNWLGESRGWWTQVQQMTADRAEPLARWVATNTKESDVIATDDDVLIHLYTGRQTIPNGAFTPEEHMKAQTPAFATATLRQILRSYHVDYVLASTEYGIYAARGLVQAQPSELRIVRALSRGGVFAPVHTVPNE